MRKKNKLSAESVAEVQMLILKAHTTIARHEKSEKRLCGNDKRGKTPWHSRAVTWVQGVESSC